MSRPDDSTVTIRATGSGPRFLALLEAAARIDGASIHCGGAQPRSVEASQEELDAAHAALAPRRAAAVAAMRERSPAVAAAIEALEQGGTVQAAAEPEPVEWDAAKAHEAYYRDGHALRVLAEETGLSPLLITGVIFGDRTATADEARKLNRALGLGGAQ